MIDPHLDSALRIPAADALLVADVGNTRIGMAAWVDGTLQSVQRISSGNEADWSAAIDSSWRRTDGVRQRAIVISSVSPRVARRFADLALEQTGAEPLFVRDDLPLPLTLDLPTDHEVGVDRVCAAAAAFERLGTACAVASFGTAITVDCVSAEGRFCGGAILPGFEMSLDALHERTASLPRVALAPPPAAFGRTTDEAILNGVVAGTIGAVRTLVERYATALGRWPALVLTGGNAPLVMPLIDFADAVVPDLSLLGIAIAHRRASAPLQRT